jgi:hypothetical protein
MDCKCPLKILVPAGGHVSPPLSVEAAFAAALPRLPPNLQTHARNAFNSSDLVVQSAVVALMAHSASAHAAISAQMHASSELRRRICEFANLLSRDATLILGSIGAYGPDSDTLSGANTILSCATVVANADHVRLLLAKGPALLGDVVGIVSIPVFRVALGHEWCSAFPFSSVATVIGLTDARIIEHTTKQVRLIRLF